MKKIVFVLILLIGGLLLLVGFGHSVGISSDTIVVGADGEDSNATGVNGNQSDNLADPCHSYISPEVPTRLLSHVTPAARRALVAHENPDCDALHPGYACLLATHCD